MSSVKAFSVGLVSAASALMVGYSYMQTREQRQENTLQNVMEDINHIFIKEKTDWEEMKDKL